MRPYLLVLLSLTIWPFDATAQRAFHSSNSPTETDINLLTGLVIEKQQKGERRPSIKKRNLKFAPRLFKDFDFLNGFGIDALGEHL